MFSFKKKGSVILFLLIHTSYEPTANSVTPCLLIIWISSALVLQTTDTEEGWLQLAETAKRWLEVRGLLLASGMLLPVIDSWLVIHHKQTAGVVPPAAAVFAAAVPLLSTGGVR